MTKKALFLAGGWDGHEPQETSRLISNEIEKSTLEKTSFEANLNKCKGQF